MATKIMKRRTAAKKSTRTRKPIESVAPPETVLVLRTCDADMCGYGGFQWPESGPVSCPDWNALPVCGGGLHGLLWGVGGGSHFNWAPDAKWVVVEVVAKDIVDLGDKVKFPRGTVIHVGDMKTAVTLICERAPKELHGKITGGAIASTSGSVSNSGDSGSASNSGYSGSASNSGDSGSASNSGYRGSASNSGDSGSASNSGDRGSASNSGYSGSASNSGYSGNTISSGKDSFAVAIGSDSIAAAGENGVIALRWHDGQRPRLLTLYVGENGIDPMVYYRADNEGHAVRVGPVAEIDKQWKRDHCPKCGARRDDIELNGHRYVSGDPCTGSLL